jgi:hypothetical protein
MQVRSSHNSLSSQSSHDDIQMMYFGTPYTFDIEIAANYKEIAAMADTGPEHPEPMIYTVDENYSDYATLFFRAILCDTRHIGFCSPLTVGDQGYEDPITLEEFLEKNGTQEGVLELEAVKDGNHLYSPYMTIQMREVEPYQFHAKARITLTLRDAAPGTFFIIGHGHLEIPVVGTAPGRNKTAISTRGNSTNLVLVSILEQLRGVFCTIHSSWLTKIV